MSKPLEVYNAQYGTEGHWVNITKEVTALIKNDSSLDFTVDPNTFKVPDPAPGIKKTCQVYVYFNGEKKEHLFQKNDGEQLVITAPPLKEEKKDDLGSSTMNIVWYTLVTFIGVFFVLCSYNFGTNGIGMQFIGILLALAVAGTSMSFAIIESGYGPVGLFFFVLFVAGLQTFLAFSIEVISPGWLNWKKMYDSATLATPE
jgi:hypothetical protein